MKKKPVSSEVAARKAQGAVVDPVITETL